VKQHLSQVLFNLTPQQHIHSAIDAYISTTKAVKMAHKVCNDCERGQLPLVYRAGFDEFIALAERLKDNAILGYLDGPLEDLLTEDIDLALARIHQCAISYRLKIGRASCDIAPFGTLLASIQEHGHLFPVHVSHPLRPTQFLKTS
jgi:hypothetical protein